MSVMEFVLDGNQGVQGQKRENDKHYYYDYYIIITITSKTKKGPFSQYSNHSYWSNEVLTIHILHQRFGQTWPTDLRFPAFRGRIPVLTGTCCLVRHSLCQQNEDSAVEDWEGKCQSSSRVPSTAAWTDWSECYNWNQDSSKGLHLCSSPTVCGTILRLPPADWAGPPKSVSLPSIRQHEQGAPFTGDHCCCGCAFVSCLLSWRLQGSCNWPQLKPP